MAAVALRNDYRGRTVFPLNTKFANVACFEKPSRPQSCSTPRRLEEKRCQDKIRMKISRYATDEGSELSGFMYYNFHLVQPTGSLAHKPPPPGGGGYVCVLRKNVAVQQQGEFVHLPFIQSAGVCSLQRNGCSLAALSQTEKSPGSPEW